MVYLLIHGAWHGSWCWNRLIPLLSASNHKAISLTLSGIGEKHNLMSTKINLDTHIEEIQSVIVQNNMQEIILVGHSYAGMLISLT